MKFVPSENSTADCTEVALRAQVTLDKVNEKVAERAADLGIGSVPAVVIDGTATDCCTSRRPDMDVLRAAGLGQPLW